MTSAPSNNNHAAPHMYGAGANTAMLVSYLAEEHGISPSSPLPYFGADSPNTAAVAAHPDDVVTILNLNDIDPAHLTEGDVFEILFPVSSADGANLDLDVYRSIETASYPAFVHHGAGAADGNVDLMLLSSDESSSLLDDEFVLPKAYSCDYDDGLMAESSVDTIVLETFPPRAPGGYLEPNCHFTVRAMPDLLLQSVMGVLQNKQVDCELNADVFKMKCEAYRNCSRVEFVVRLFTTGDEATAETPLLAVEFQRRFGEPSYFHELYHLTRDTLTSVFDKDESHDVSNASQSSSSSYASLSSSSAATAASSTSACPNAAAFAASAGRSLMQAPPLDLPDVQACVESRRSTLSSLIQMCSSECVDVKVAGISMLADLSSQCAMRELMLSNGCVDIFLSCLCSTIADVHRCAITGLANLISCATNKALCQRMLQCPIARSNLCGLTTSDCPQVVRESARAMSFLASTLPDAALTNPEIQQSIRTLALSEDEEARQRAHRILEAASTQAHHQ